MFNVSDKLALDEDLLIKLLKDRKHQMDTDLKNSDDRLACNFNEETQKKEEALRDLTDCLMRVVSGKPSRRNSTELKAALASTKNQENEKKADSVK